MSTRRRAAMAALAALSLLSLAFLFGAVTERMRAACERSGASALTRETAALSQTMEDGR
jgi:hypothetical protein